MLFALDWHLCSTWFLLFLTSSLHLYFVSSFKSPLFFLLIDRPHTIRFYIFFFFLFLVLLVVKCDFLLVFFFLIEIKNKRKLGQLVISVRWTISSLQSVFAVWGDPTRVFHLCIFEHTYLFATSTRQRIEERERKRKKKKRKENSTNARIVLSIWVGTTYSDSPLLPLTQARNETNEK